MKITSYCCNFNLSLITKSPFCVINKIFPPKQIQYSSQYTIAFVSHPWMTQVTIKFSQFCKLPHSCLEATSLRLTYFHKDLLYRIARWYTEYNNYCLSLHNALTNNNFIIVIFLCMTVCTSAKQNLILRYSITSSFALVVK